MDTIIKNGDMYGQLTVIDRAGLSNHGHAQYRCRCSCGRQALVLAHHLRSGNTQTCGQCGRRNRLQRGQIFGHLVVLADWQGQKNRRRERMYWCGCDCGNEEYLKISGVALRSGRRVSCGRCSHYASEGKSRRWHRVGVSPEVLSKFNDLLDMVDSIRKHDPDCYEVYDSDSGGVLWRDDVRMHDITQWGVWNVPEILDYLPIRSPEFDTT